MGKRVAYLVFVAALLGVVSAAWGQKKASDPNPVDGAGDVGMPLFRWTAGSTAVFHDVYLGKTPELGREQLVAPRQVLPMLYYVPGLEPGIQYYWRVDEIEKDGTTVITGDVWTFWTQALTAYNPDPADGAVNSSVAPVLKWWAGVGAAKHHVYFSDDRDAVSQAAAAADKGTQTLEEKTFAPGALEPATAYYWRVDEVLGDGTVKTGPVWSFTTVVPVDDFESYTDDEGSRIYETWIDGWTNSTGSTVGYVTAPFAEQKIVYGGRQSMPMEYNNVAAPFYSEAERTFDTPQDWTADGADTLTVHIRGRTMDFEILSVSTPPVIDGKEDEIWKTASVQPIVTPIINTMPLSSSSQFRVLYDMTNLYVLVDINDDKLRNDSPEAWYDDSVEFYVDGDNTKKGPGLEGNARQYTFGWTATDIQGTNTDVTGVEFAQVDTPTGWRLEIKLPWQSLLGAGAPVGKLIGIDCFYDDDDLNTGVQESQVAWHSKAEPDWETPASWGTALLAPPGVKPDADPIYVALQDSAKHVGVVTHPDAQLAKAQQWVEWKIPLNAFADAGVKLTAVQKIMIGVGDRATPAAGGTGVVFIDDIYLTKP
jgi:hypothetical protein